MFCIVLYSSFFRFMYCAVFMVLPVSWIKLYIYKYIPFTEWRGAPWTPPPHTHTHPAGWCGSHGRSHGRSPCQMVSLLTVFCWFLTSVCCSFRLCTDTKWDACDTPPGLRRGLLPSRGDTFRISLTSLLSVRLSIFPSLWRKDIEKKHIQKQLCLGNNRQTCL